jgi:hypothetical protein
MAPFVDLDGEPTVSPGFVAPGRLGEAAATLVRATRPSTALQCWWATLPAGHHPTRGRVLRAPRRNCCAEF